MRFLTGLFLLCFLVGSQPAFAAGGGGGGGGFSSSRSAPKKTPKQIAIDNYNKGLKHRDKAWKYEEKATAATKEKKREKLLKSAQKQYKKAIKRYNKAIDKRPEYFQAYSSLGYAMRKTGDIEGSLVAYNKSIEINPIYPEAIEYRAETYLRLNRFDDVKEAYMDLFTNYERKYADQLMEAMNKWLQQNGQASSEAANSFSQWIKEREEIARNTASLDQPQTSNWEQKI